GIRAFLQDGDLLGDARNGTGCFYSQTGAEIAEALVALPLFAPALEQRLEGGDNLTPRCQIAQLEVEPISMNTPADIDDILVARPSNDPDVALVGSDTAIGTAGHADAEGFLAEAHLNERAVEIVHDAGQGA